MAVHQEDGIPETLWKLSASGNSFSSGVSFPVVAFGVRFSLLKPSEAGTRGRGRRTAVGHRAAQVFPTNLGTFPLVAAHAVLLL